MRIALAALTLAVGGLAGCVSGAGGSPTWMEPAEAQTEYPSLRDVPRSHDANVDPGHWAAVQRDVIAAGEALKAHPRSAPPSQTQDPAAFLEEARRDLEETRQSHEP